MFGLGASEVLRWSYYNMTTQQKKQQSEHIYPAVRLQHTYTAYTWISDVELALYYKPTAASFWTQPCFRKAEMHQWFNSVKDPTTSTWHSALPDNVWQEIWVHVSHTRRLRNTVCAASPLHTDCLHICCIYAAFCTVICVFKLSDLLLYILC